jgi:hypothetical protein
LALPPFNPLLPLLPIRRLLLVAVLCGHAGAGFCSVGPMPAAAHTMTDKYQVWRSAAVRALESRGDADALAAAATLAFVGDHKPRPDPSKGDSQALELALQASTLAPDSQAIGWIRMRLCTLTPGCDVRDAATALRWLDPDNAAAWLPTLTAAHRDRDQVEIDRVLADMAQGIHFDFYWNRIAVLLYDQLRAVHKSLPKGYVDSEAARLDEALGITSGEFIPPFSTLMETCKESMPGTPRRESCFKIAKSMQQGDTVITQIAGLSLEKRLVVVDGKEYRALLERRRVLEWRVATAGQFDQALLPWVKNAHARWRLARMRALPREEDVLLAILRQQGSPIDPPDAN